MPYPEQKELIKDLVLNTHVALDDEPLLLAIYYNSEVTPNEECLFEVARNFGYNEPDEDKHIFQIQFGASPQFRLPEGRYLHLSLTNPVEFKVAVEEEWPEVKDLQGAVLQGNYQVLYPQTKDREADELMSLLSRQLITA